VELLCHRARSGRSPTVSAVTATTATAGNPGQDLTAELPDITIMSWNLAEYGRPGAAAERAPQIIEAIRRHSPTILAAQEIFGSDPEMAASHVRGLAVKTGLQCQLPDGQTAVAHGFHDMNAAILWNPQRVKPVAGSWRTYGIGEQWHSAILGTVEVDGEKLTVCSYLAPSLEKNRRADEAERLILGAISGYTSDRMIIACDQNSLSNALNPDGTYYDDDPYLGKENEPDPAFVHQCLWEEGPNGEIQNLRADRRPAQTLSFGGKLRDLAPTIGEKWYYTIGHQRPDGPHGLRRIDLVWGTDQIVAETVSCRAVDDPVTQAASDHLPVLTILRKNGAAR
jgi:hypothetical protein